MILRFLRLFAAFRETQTENATIIAKLAEASQLCADLNRQLDALRTELSKASGQVEYWKATSEGSATAAAFWRERCGKAESDAESLERELIDKLTIAGDAMALRLTNRRMFSKASVEAPPAEAHPPINVSPGAGKRFASDVARQKTDDFFKNLAQQAGVMPKDGSDPKPN